MKQAFYLTMMALALSAPGLVKAAPINYGDHAGTDVWFRQVTENSLTDPGPLYGAPTVSANTIDFSPLGFASFSQNGTLDSTDGALTLGIEAKTGHSIPFIQITEGGSYSFNGFPNSSAAASVTGSIFFDIFEVDGVAIPAGPNTQNVSALLMVSTGSGPQGGAYAMGVDPSTALWHGNLNFDLNAYLTAKGISYTQGVTKMQVTLNNNLRTLASQGASALINKSDFDVTITVPEPSGLVAATIALAGLAFFSRRRA